MQLGIVKGAAMVLCAALLAAACGDEEEDIAPGRVPSGSTTPPANPPDDPMDPPDDPMDPPDDPMDPPDDPMNPVDDLGQTILEVISASDNLSTFGRLLGQLNAQGLVDNLNGAGPLTVFVPTDEAFETWPFEVSELPPEQLATILSYHVISGALITSSMVEDGVSEDSLEGGQLSFDVAGDAIVVNGLTTVTQADIDASNGVVHVIDGLLVPPGSAFPGTLRDALSYYSGLAMLRTAVDEAGSGFAEALAEDNTSTFTFFAATSSGFPDGGDSLLGDPDALGGFLQYHVLPDVFHAVLSPSDILAPPDADGPRQATFPTLGDGPADGLEDSPHVVLRASDDGVQINDSNVIFGGLITSNVTVYVIDQALRLPEDIVTVARTNPELSRFVELLEQQNLVTLLQSPGETSADPGFTVFAPTNEAFEGLEALPQGDMLTELLRSHVARGQIDSATLVGFSGVRLTTLASNFVVRNSILIDLEDGAVVLSGGARLSVSDIVASNGIIHVIDSVLDPEQ